MRSKVVHTLLLLVMFSPAGKSASNSNVELQALRVTFETKAHEISGAARMNRRLYVVSDGPDDHSIYAVEDSGTRFTLRLAVDLRSIRGYKEHLRRTAGSDGLPGEHRADFEGLAACGRDFYVANERAREILRIKNGSSFERLSIDFSGYRDLQGGGDNAGFEGVAVDCARNMLYVAKERSPRVIFVVRMSDWKVVATHDITSMSEPGEDRGGGKDRTTIARDFSDLAFDHGYLYVVERSRRAIAKVEPDSMRVVSSASYAKTEHDLYESDPRFGQAEALVLTAREIILGFDNNRSPLSRASERKYGISGNPPAIMYFRRPAGF